MAVTRNSRSIVMTADNDAVLGRIHVLSIRVDYDGATASSLVNLTETSGAVIARHLLEHTDGSTELNPNPRWVDGIIAETLPANCVLVIQTD